MSRRPTSPLRSWADLLFAQGFGSRRECAALIAAGRLEHAGQPVEDPAATVDTTGLHFRVDGVDWPWHEPTVLLLHKPAGVECSAAPREHPGVHTLLPAPLVRRGVQPVGRLDVDTTGLLVLTDDGALAHRLTHPKRHVAKVYLATCRHPVDDGALAALVDGVLLRDDPQPVRAADAERLDQHRLRLTLTDGRYHQVKRMIAAVGNRCEALHRETFGPWTLPADLPPGHWRWAGLPPG